MVFSDYPSVWRWCAVLRSNIIPKVFYIFIQIQEVNEGSLSDIMLEGTPCSLTTFLIYNLVSLASEKSIWISMKRVILVSLSTITQMAFFLRNVIGSPVTKSMVILSHFHYGSSNYCNNLECLWYSALTC